MGLSAEERNAIVKYRVEKAENAFIEAKDNAKLNHWTLTANRLYYACFHISTALLLKNGYVSKTHSGTISLIGQHFVEKGSLSAEDARMLTRLMNMRTSGDYTDFFEYTENDILPFFKIVEDYISKVKTLIYA
jgi:uncharacterized protein (UPF0332 family)